MKIIYTQQCLSPMRIIISDNLLERVIYWQKFLCDTQTLQSEMLSCKLSVLNDFSSAVKIERGYNSDDLPIAEISSCWISVYKDAIFLEATGEDGIDNLLDCEDLTKVSDVYFSKDLCHYAIIEMGNKLAYDFFIENYILQEHKQNFKDNCEIWKANNLEYIQSMSEITEYIEKKKDSEIKE